MNFFAISIRSVQSIRALDLEFELSTPRLFCLVGRNGVGKTTLMRALRNLSSGDTFLKTANPQIFNEDSVIGYKVDNEFVEFTFDGAIKTLNCKKQIPKRVRESISAELPMPHGARFNYFRSASEADRDIRTALITGDFRDPRELKEFLASMYSTNRFDNLVEVVIRGRSYYCVRLLDGRYIREDYLSSGEYFLINLYRTIKGSAKLIAVDEIDLSLDAAAQANLMVWLRRFCSEYGCSMLFTTHSLAVMRTLEASELRYMEVVGDFTQCYPVSYSYAKARLFGFHGWDRYILTEDKALRAFLEYVIQRHCANSFFSVKVIHIGGADQVVDLMSRNATEQFLAAPGSVISVLDGDRRETANGKRRDVYCIPMDSVEKAVLKHYNDEDFPYRLPVPKEFNGPKDAMNSILEKRVATIADLHAYLCAKYDDGMKLFVTALDGFLGIERSASERDR